MKDKTHLHLSLQSSDSPEQNLPLLLELKGLRPEFDRWNLPVLGRPRLFIFF